MLTWSNFLSQLFNGLAQGALLALISSGLTIIYGTLGVLNLAHGAMFMLGGYAGYVAYQATGSFVVAVVAGTLSDWLVKKKRTISTKTIESPNVTSSWSSCGRP